MEYLIPLIKEWQEIFGALIGAIGALLVAYVVAGSAQRRAERIAATVLMAPMLDFIGVAIKLKQEWANLDAKQKENINEWIGSRTIWMWPTLPNDFESSRATVCEVDIGLATQLELFHNIYRTMRDAKSRFDLAAIHGGGNPDVMRGDRIKIGIALTTAAPHAFIAARLLEKLILARHWRWNRLLRRINKTQLETTFKAELKKLAPGEQWPD